MKNQIASIMSILSIVAALLLGFYLFEVALMNMAIFWTIIVCLVLVAIYIDWVNKSSDDAVRIEGKHAFAIVIMVGCTAATVATVTAFTVVRLV